MELSWLAFEFTFLDSQKFAAQLDID